MRGVDFSVSFVAAQLVDLGGVAVGLPFKTHQNDGGTTIEESIMAFDGEEALLVVGDLGAVTYNATLESPVLSHVFEALFPGDDIVEIEKPEVGGGLGYRFVKRAFDLGSCVVALVLLAIPMAVIAARIKVESPGPAIYAQRRVGLGGKEFFIYKFRSMYLGAEARGAQWAADGDPRVTPFGKELRRTRLDEVPQFWNVVKGDMSLIGPRPERPVFCKEFERRIHGWCYRTLVKPGISGLAQVTGGYDLLPEEKVLMDMEYIKHRSSRMDISIIAKTLKTIFTGDGAR